VAYDRTFPKRRSIGEHLEKVVAAVHWQTPSG
jgi:hypothetical protein